MTLANRGEHGRHGRRRAGAARAAAALLALPAALCLGAPQEAEQAFVEAVRRDTERLAAHASRVPGTTGHEEGQGDLLRAIRDLPGVPLFVQEFPVLVPVVTRAELAVPAGPLRGTHRIHPLWPDLVRLQTTPEEGLAGKVVYVGDASATNLPARGLRGQIAAMEMSSSWNWQGPFEMGADALLLLGGPDDRPTVPADQPLCKPRYYVAEGPLADAIRRGEVAEARVFCDAEWKTVTARNLYAAVPASSPSASAPPMAIACAYDSMSVVMGLAPGADNAVDAALVLNLLRVAQSEQPRRALLFCFLDACAFNQRGAREMLTLLTATREDGTRQDYEKMEAKRLSEYRELAQQAEDLGAGREGLERLADKNRFRELQRCVKDRLGPEILAILEEMGKLRLERYSAAPARKAEVETLLEQRVRRLRQLNRVLSGITTSSRIQDADLPEALSVWEAVRTRVRSQLAESRDQMAYFERLDAVRVGIAEALGAEGSGAPPVSFLLGIDLSDAGVAAGPGLLCRHLWTREGGPARDFLRWLKEFLKSPEAAGLRPALNLDAAAAVEDAASFSVGPVALLTSPAASFNLPAVTWLTLDALRPRADTPRDRADLLDWARLAPQVTATAGMIRQCAADPSFAPQVRSAGYGKPRWRMARGSVVSESVAETVPRTPMTGLLVTLTGGGNNSPGPAGAAGIRRHEFVRAGSDGRFCFPPMPGHPPRQITALRARAFGLDERGRIRLGVSDSVSMIAGRVSAAVNLAEGPSASPARLVAFECRELNGPEFFDPQFLEPLSQFSLLDVTRGGAPKRYHFSVHNGQMFGLLPPGTRWQLILRAGAAANRMALLNVNPDLAGGEASLRQALRTGWPLDEPLPSIPAHVSARDFHALDRWRMARFADAGIRSKAIESVYEEAGQCLKMADQALASDDGPALRRAANAALAGEVRAYEAIRATGDDVTRGAIFLMLLLVPFSIAMERLLFACARIGRRITASLLVFLCMALILWSFHPAFRITVQPLIIVMAFAILLMSLVVIVLVLRKFESDLQAMRSGRAEAGAAQTRRGGLVGSALWLGIANMRKRRLRTVLTATTIVLITFALLCFSSSTYYQQKRQLTLRGVKAPYAGILIRQARSAALPHRAIAEVANLLEPGCAPVRRYWWTSTEPNWRIHVRVPGSGRQASLKAALGLSPEESGLTRPDRWMRNWERFARGNGCYLSSRTAEELGVRPGDPLVVAGQVFELVDTFEAGPVERELRMLDGQSLLPFDYAVRREERREREREILESEMAAGIGLEPDTEAVHVAGDQIAVLPADFVARVGGQLRSLAVRTGSAEAAEAAARSLTRVLAFPVYYGAGEQVRVMVSTPLLPRLPRSLVVPLLIASLIIFNTMLNSVAERKGEIHIYMSLGLAPVHVGVLFLAEALTYGLMGSVFGYVAGQGLATALTRWGLMGGITLNYSGSGVILTMGIVLGVVTLSALVPAYMAGKLATPSAEMRWTVPEPREGVIRDLLPFTVTKKAAGGLVAFVHEYMDAHREGGIGRFTADDLALLPPAPDRAAGLTATVWLAPYDLGVRQKVRIDARPETEDICVIHVELTRGSGQERTWWRLNKTFLADVRRQLLGWRKVKPERMLEYIARAASGRPAPARSAYAAEAPAEPWGEGAGNP